MDFLNSKYLTSQNGYIHAFREAGRFTYTAAITDCEQAASGTIVVQAAKTATGEGAQHDVVLHWDQFLGRYVPNAGECDITIQQNDFVVFHFDKPLAGQPPCFIVGRSGERTVFDSRKLQTHDAFTHFFLTSGDYAYRVGDKMNYVSVADHRQFSPEDHTRKMQEPPTVILINGNRIGMEKAKIVAGQIVIWAVEQGENLSIEVELNPQPLPPRGI